MLYSFLLLLLCTSCGEGKRNIKKYYFPLIQLQNNGLVYEYETAEEERLPPFYWYYQSIRDTTGKYLIGTYYDYDFTPFQFVREEMVENGMTLADFYFYETDSLTNTQSRIPVEIQSKNVFPFYVDEEKPSVLLYSIQWDDPKDLETKLTLVRNRQFAGDTTYIYQNKKYAAIKFYVRELIDNFKEGHLEQEYDGLEIYAKNLGLVYFEKNVSEDFIIKYKLKDTYKMTVLEEKFKAKMENVSE